MVQQRCAHVPAPHVETGAALLCWKADPSITMVCGMESGVAGEGVPRSRMLGGLLGPASAQERGPGASQARWGGPMDAGRRHRSQSGINHPQCVRWPELVPGWASPCTSGTGAHLGAALGRFYSTTTVQGGEG